MLKRTFNYVDFNGNQRKEDYYFHLSKPEISKFLITNGDYTYDTVLNRLLKEHQVKDLVEIFDDLIRLSVGKISDDGRRFMKNDEIRDDFLQTPAYDQLFMELANDDKKAVDFLNAILPDDLESEVRKLMENNQAG